MMSTLPEAKILEARKEPKGKERVSMNIDKGSGSQVPNATKIPNQKKPKLQ